MNEKKDILGQALLDFHYNKEMGRLIIESEELEEEEMDISYYFRNYDQMPEYEQLALDLCKGKVLDVGAGAGCHALHLQKSIKNVKAIDTSAGAVEVMKERGVQDAVCVALEELKGEKFDSILLLMNGIGISGRLSSLATFLQHLLGLLTTGGQIIFDSTDLRYLYMEEDGSFWIDLNADYYGEVTYRYSYRNDEGEPFPWLFIDEENMIEISKELGLKMEVIYRNEDFHYLAVLTK